MTKYSQYFFLFIGFLFFARPGFAQEYAPMDKADNAYQSGKYMDAIELYKKAYEHLTDKQYQKIRNKKVIRGKIVFQIAECFRELDQPLQAVQWYQKALQGKCADSVSAKQNMEAEQKLIPEYKEAAIPEYKQYQFAKPNERDTNVAK